ncbi:MAG: class I mannose-6-phosphate isomerase [Bacteroidaceae bacterium]|nr:class I mannose-6-phosphate isomerase [Bacteroidaceae bacterium]
MNILKFAPIHKKLIWGSETWVVSAVPDSPSVLADSSAHDNAESGITLPMLVKEFGPQLVGKRNWEYYGENFPLLVKFIDAHDDLSIQVHPNDELASKRHGCMGKTEMWFVMDAGPGAHLYSGFKKSITKAEYEKMVTDGSIMDALQCHPVKRGDVFFIPSGRVHAICGGIRLAEIQQTSDITYRIFDYNRPGLDGKMRKLHTELAKDAIDFNIYPTYQTDYLSKINNPVAITHCPYFTVKIHNITRPYHRKLYKYDSFIIYICLNGDCMIRKHRNSFFSRFKKNYFNDNDGSVSLKKGESCVVPMSCADIDLVPNNNAGLTELLEVYVDNKNFNQSRS